MALQPPELPAAPRPHARRALVVLIFVIAVFVVIPVVAMFATSG